MSDDVSNHRALLPAGLRDLLPPDAETEAGSVEALMEVFAAHGYQRVKPPLLEFEDSLLAGSGAAVAEQTFRLMDPDSQRMMGLRADTTPQVARIATTRLARRRGPLRLSYAGQCLRVRGSQLAPDRQIAQAGIELIGCDNPAADAEIVLVGAEALAAMGLIRISFDLTLPTLVPALLDDAGNHRSDPGCAGTGAGSQGRRVGGTPRRQPGADVDRTAAGRRSGGPRSGRRWRQPGCRGRGRDLADRLAEAVAAIRARAPALRLTVDPVEFRGFRYETGVSVTIYAPGRHEELGRGGRYICGEAEPATGPDAVPGCRAARRSAAQGTAAALHPVRCATPTRLRACGAVGYATIAALAPTDDPAAEARRLLCSHILQERQRRAPDFWRPDAWRMSR